MSQKSGFFYFVLSRKTKFKNNLDQVLPTADDKVYFILHSAKYSRRLTAVLDREMLHNNKMLSTIVGGNTDK